MPGRSQRTCVSEKRATRWRFRSVLALAIIAPVIALTAAMRRARSPRPHAAVPGPPSGWSTVFSDDFNGGAGSGIDSQWIYDTGPGSNFGTGEIETMTNSTTNVHLDGNGNLDITAMGSGSSWTSGRGQTTAPPTWARPRAANWK